MIQFTLYSRAYCHLCDQMLEALQAFPAAHALSIEVVDVDADPALVEQYDELVPVLTGRIGNNPEVKLCHYFLDIERLRCFLAGGVNSDDATTLAD